MATGESVAKRVARLSLVPAAEVPVGKRYGPYTHELTDAMANTWVRALDDRDPAYTDDSAARQAGYPGRIAPPGVVTLFFLKAAMDAYDGIPSGMILASQEVELHAPACPGDKLATEFHIVNKTIRKDRPWVDLEFRTRNQRGETVAVSRITWIWPR